MKIWGAETARSFRPIWVAEEMGLTYEHLAIQPRTGETQTEAYTALNRKQKIPFLEDGDLKLSESVAICRYLIEAYDGGPFWVPRSLAERTRQDEWCSYIYGEIDETSLYVMRRHRDLRAIYGGNDEVVASAAAYLQRHLIFLETHLQHHEYIEEQGFGLCDVLLVSCLDWAAHYGIEIPPHVDLYRERIAHRDGYLRAMAINYKELMGAA